MQMLGKFGSPWERVIPLRRGNKEHILLHISFQINTWANQQIQQRDETR